MDQPDHVDTANESNPEAIRADIEATRARLSETAEALAYKTDVPARAKDALNDRATALGTSVGAAVMRTSDALQSVLDGEQPLDVRPAIAKSLALGTTASKTARKRPLAFAVGAFTVGFAFGRVWPRRAPKKDSDSAQAS